MNLGLWFSAFPGLLWEIEHRRSRINFYNSWTLPALGENTPRLLKDAHFRKRTILEIDLPLVEEFWDMAMHHKNGMVSFRLESAPDSGCLLQGWPHPQDGEKYFGMLKESVLPSAFMLKGSGSQCELALARSYPVLLLDTGREEIIASNAPARALFGDCCGVGQNARMEGIAPGDLGAKLLAICQEAIRGGSLTGPVTLRDGNGNIFCARARISSCAEAPELARLALVNVPEKPPRINMETAGSFRSMDLRTGLHKLMSHCPGLDGLMFSDIQPRPGQVEVYGVGPLFEGLAWGAPHAYEGTIAQDIERYSLDSLVVENTLDSIKSIDWAMFIPCGVRSYFAKPFYAENGLHAVLILAFGQPSSSPLREESFEGLFEPFAALIEGWRERGE